MILIEQISWDLRKATFLANQYKEYDWNVWKQVKKSNWIKLKIQANESHILFKWIPRYWHRCGAIEFVWQKSGCSWQRHHLKSLFGHLDSRWMSKIKWTLGDKIDQISPPPLCKTCFSTSEWIWHTKKYLVNLQKFWDLGRPPPPCWEKFPNNIVFFFESVPKWSVP